METRPRLLVVLGGLPEPVVNHILRDEAGGWTYLFDLSWPHLRIVLEYDGRQHAESTGQWVRDVRRREDLERVAAVLREHGQAIRITDGWREHFPERG